MGTKMLSTLESTYNPIKVGTAIFVKHIDFEKTLSQEYKNEVRKKEVEITQLQRSLLKDSMRIAFFELGKIHYSYGYVGEAIKAWIKSHDFSQSEEDLFNIAFQIAQAAFEVQSSNYLLKFSGEADARDKNKNPTKTMVIKVLDGLSYLLFDNFKETSYRLSSVSLTDDPCLSQIGILESIDFLSDSH